MVTQDQPPSSSSVDGIPGVSVSGIDELFSGQVFGGLAVPFDDVTMEASIGAKPFEEQSFGLDAKFDSSE